MDNHSRRILKINSYDVVPFELLKTHPICAYIYVWLQRRSEDGVYTVLETTATQIANKLEISTITLKNSFITMKRLGYITFMYQTHKNTEYYGVQGLRYIFLLYQHEIEDYVFVTDEPDEHVSLIKRLMKNRSYHSIKEARRLICKGQIFSDIKPTLNSRTKRVADFYVN